MDEKQRDNFLKVLEHLRKRPLMYFSSDAPAVANFLEGFTMAFLMSNPTTAFYQVRQEVIEERSWDGKSTQAVWHQMQERGYDDEAIITEMLAIYSIVLERILLQSIVETESNPKP
jgi:hypothetical protein